MTSNFLPADYIPGESFIHRLDPRSKMILVLAYIIIVFAVQNEWQLILLAIFLLVLLSASHIPLKLFWLGIRPFLFIIIITALLQALTTQGPPLLSWRFINLSREGIRMGILLAIRLFLIIIVARWMLTTTSYLEMIAALEKFMQPLTYLRLPCNELIMVMGIALKFIPLLEEEAQAIHSAQAARGMNWHNAGLTGKFRFWLALLVPLLTAVFQRAEELSQAMESRGFNPGEPRSRLTELRMKWPDYITLGLGVVSLAAIKLMA